MLSAGYDRQCGSLGNLLDVSEIIGKTRGLSNVNCLACAELAVMCRIIGSISKTG